MEAHLNQVMANVQNSIAPSTMAGYQSAWWLWVSFLKAYGVSTDFVSEGLILLFLDSLFNKDYLWSHVNNISGIYVFLKFNNLP